MQAKHHIEKSLREGYKVVVVVSAMGRKGDPYATDTLLSLVNGTSSKLSKREQDLLMSVGETISSVVFTNLLLENGLKRFHIQELKQVFLQITIIRMRKLLR